MPFDSQKLNQFKRAAFKKSQEIKGRFWDHETNRLALLFILSAILIAAFAFHQYARRNFAISSLTQKNHNEKLRSRLGLWEDYSKKLNILQQITGEKSGDKSFFEKLGKTGIEQIKHEAELLANCTAQYEFNESKLNECHQALDDLLQELKDFIPKSNSST